MFAHKCIHNDFADNWIHNDEFGFRFASHFAWTQHMSHNVLLASDDGKVWKLNKKFETFMTDVVRIHYYVLKSNKLSSKLPGLQAAGLLPFLGFL